MKKRTAYRLCVYSLIAALLVIASLEGLARWQETHDAPVVPSSVEAMWNMLPNSRITGREIGNQMIVHNVALFSRDPDPDAVTIGFVGTSRSKVIRPSHFGIEHAANGSGNSYTDINFGLLMQAEALRHAFPNMHTLYVEASLLERRPGRLILEADHRKYLPLLEELLPLHQGLPGDDIIRQQLYSVLQPNKPKFDFKLHVLQRRSGMKLSDYLFSDKEINVNEEKLMTQLTPTGERRELSRRVYPPTDWLPVTKEDNPKVQRLLQIESWAPWDGLFDMFARWGKVHGIKIIFYQPPVRSDLYEFQVQNGLALHVADMQRIAKENNIPFIDLDRPDMHYSDDWELFADEDHMETCLGAGLLTLALEAGYRQFRQSGELFPKVERTMLMASPDAVKLKQCDTQ